MNPPDSTTTRPYLIRALYEWCTDNGFTPYVAVLVDGTVQVPREYVKNGEIVLNISYDATSSLKLGNDFIEFRARFAGTAREIMVPVSRVIAIYARENGQGMAFPMPPAPGEEGASRTALTGVPAPTPIAPTHEAPETAAEGAAPAATKGSALTEPKVVQLVPTESAGTQPPDPADPPRPPAGPRPALKRVK
ncbi:MAG: ClpXP protease specificity-enhancing factor [Burkholderiaceae bacterium]|nr:ClpXP protease specificity-enhancing factor [Burkholderiaceae bacterium]MDO9089550.1 ClpXP protease specificity-enhancing factor [Burkholderiaceae bacterium]